MAAWEEETARVEPEKVAVVEEALEETVGVVTVLAAQATAEEGVKDPEK